MVNRSRSETWTYGINNQQIKQKLHSCSSESTLEYHSSILKSSFNNANFDCIKSSKNVTYNGSIWLESQQNSNRRPVFSTASMESVELIDQKDSTGDTDSLSSVGFEHNDTSSRSSEDVKQDLPNSQPSLIVQIESNCSSPAKSQDKSNFSSFFSWLSPRNHLKQQTVSKITATNQGNCSHSLSHDEKLENSQRSISLRRTSVSLDRGISGLKNLKESIKSSLSSVNSPGIRRNHSFDPLSTTALILEDRPSHLPSKTTEEIEKHQLQYNKMLKNAKKQEKKNSLRREKLLKEQQKQEKAIANTGLIWSNEIVPNWKATYQTSRVRNLWWHGLPSSVRGNVWKLAIGNDLNITKDLYEIMLNRAHEKLRLFNEGRCERGETVSDSADKEGTMDLIHLDISRTFPHLCIFQKGAPYYDLLHDILGAYVSYRPDVGYVQGMSFMAATLLLNMETAEAFIAFANIMNKPCQVAFYRLDEAQIRTYFATYNVFFEENLPKLFAHFKQLRLTPDIYLIDWIFTIFSKALNLDVACRVWDLFCRDGEEFVFRTALALLKLHADVLLHSDFIHSAQLLTKLPTTITQQQLFSCINDVNMVARGNRRWKHVLASMKNVK